MKNSRTLEFRSLKGPKRKLKLVLIDGKRYIKKYDLEQYFFKDNWRIPDFRYHFGIGHRIVRASLYRWFSKEEIEASHKKKLSISQIGERNSNRCNWYRPHKLLPLVQLEESIRNHSNKRGVKEDLQLTSWELSYLQQYYNFRLPKKNFIDKFAKHHLHEYEVVILSKLLDAFELGDDLFSGRELRESRAIKRLISITYELRLLIRKLKKYNRKLKIHMPSNLVEYLFYKELVEYYPKIIPQYYIKDLNIHVDFLLDDKNILELDGNMHSLEKDNERDELLLERHYIVHRVDLDQYNIGSKPSSETRKNIRLCLRKLKLLL